MLPYIVSVITLAIAALVQTTSIFVIASVKPNLVFALLCICAHIYKSWPKRALLILIPALLLKCSPTLAWIDVIFIAVAFLIMALVDYFPWRRIINSAFAVALGTVAVGVPAFNLSSIAIETALNIALILILFFPLEFIYEKEKEKQTTRF